MKRAGRRLWMVFVAICCLTAGSLGAGEAQLSEKARMLLDYQSFMRGDRDGGVRFSLTASRELVGTPLADLAVRIALWYTPAELSGVGVGEVEARRVMAAEGELSAEHRDALRRFVARSFHASGRLEDALALHRRRGLAMSWLVAGPFTGRRGAGFESREVPEGGALCDRDVIDNPPDAATFAAWRKNPPWRPLPLGRSFPFVRPWRGSGVGVDGSMLMFTRLEMPEADNKAALHIHAETSWRLFVDGALVAEADKNSREEPVEHMVAYPLGAGRHEVLFQLFPPPPGVDRDSVRVALRLESDTAFSWTRDAAVPKAFVPTNARREARPLRFLEELRRQMNGDATLTAAYALACLEQDMFDQAAWWAAEAARLDPNDPKLQYLAGATAAVNLLLPTERRRDIATGHHERAVAAKPDLVPSLLYLAKRASEAEKPREAKEFLNRAYAVNPASLDVLLARGEWARAFASGATARAAWDECGKAFPNSPAAQMAIAAMPRDGFLDMDRRLAACRAAYEAGPYLPEAGLMLAEALSDSGSPQEAEFALKDALERFDGDVGAMAGIAEIYARLGMYPAAVAVMSDAVRITPDNSFLWRRLGDFHMESGNAEAAAKFWGVSLAANPGQFELADMMAYLDGKPSRLYNEGSYDAIAMTAGADADNYSADVVRLLDRSVVMFEEDGSFRHLTHEIDLARTRAGGESLTGIDPRGELLTARIVFPNGNTLEPEPYPGQGGLRLPVIIPGAAREVRVLESFPAGAKGPQLPKPWFFQDPNGRMPFLISEYVVRAPRDFPLVHVVRNLGRNVEFEFTQEDGQDVYRWTARLSMPSREPDAVHVSERVPSVEIGPGASWEDVVFHELRRLDGRLTPSMRMRSLLGNLIRSSEDYPDPERAARAIYRYVCDNIDPTPSGTTAAHIHADRMGDRSLLLLALLRAAGLDAQMAAARPATAYLHPPTWEFPDRGIFTVPMVRLSLPSGKVFWLDTRFDALPFGRITNDLSGALLLTFSPDGPLFETLPELPAGDSLVFQERLIQLPADADRLVVSGRTVTRGTAGLARGQGLADADAATRRQTAHSSLYPLFPDAELRRFDILRPDDDDPSSQERYEIASGYVLEERPDGARAAPLCLLPPRVISRETRNLARRRTSCHIKSVHVAEDRNVFILPEKGRFLRLPRAAHIPSRFGVYQLRVVPHGDNGVEVLRNYHIPAQRVLPWEWADFLVFLEKVDLAEKQWIEYAVE